ncbi:hypothetical protein VTK26DRAFT_6533 [Humicola hyalothermophila]
MIVKQREPTLSVRYRSSKDAFAWSSTYVRYIRERVRPSTGLPTGPDPSKVCNACGLRGHNVRYCIKPNAEGDLFACPFCEEFKTHLPEKCSKYNNGFSDDDISRLFVENRGWKCQFRTEDPKVQWVSIVRARMEKKPNEKPLRMYPHSREFARARYFENPERHTVHDYKIEPFSLVGDRRTVYRAVLLEDHDLALVYDGTGVVGTIPPETLPG